MTLQSNAELALLNGNLPVGSVFDFSFQLFILFPVVYVYQYAVFIVF
jgi:hypothetical protein